MADTDKKFLDDAGVNQFAEETKKYVDNKVSQLDDKYIRSDDTTVVRLRNQNEINLQEDHQNAWFGYRGGKVTNWKFGDGTEGGLADVYVKDLYLGDQKLSDLLGAKANDDDVVHKSGNETIAGNKTFSNSPTVTRQGVGTVGYNVKLAFKRGEEISATNHSTFRIIDADNNTVSEVCTENYSDGKVAQILNVRNTNDEGEQVQSSISHLLDKSAEQDIFYSTRNGKTSLGASTYKWKDVQTYFLNGKTPETIEEQGDGYIRYSNGLQICWGKITATQGITVQTSFPKSFASGTVISVTTGVAGSNSMYVNVSNIATSYCDFYITAGSGLVLWQAIGYWK